MKVTRILVAILALTLLGTGTVWAGKAASTKKSATPAAAKAPAAKVQVASGEVVSVSDTSLVLSHKVKGKAEQTTYTVNSDTKKEGDVATGSKVTVHFKSENGSDVATLVKAKPAKAAKPAKPAKTAKAAAPKA